MELISRVSHELNEQVRLLHHGIIVAILGRRPMEPSRCNRTLCCHYQGNFSGCRASYCQQTFQGSLSPVAPILSYSTHSATYSMQLCRKQQIRCAFWLAGCSQACTSPCVP